jgi:hypothetical protein
MVIVYFRRCFLSCTFKISNVKIGNLVIISVTACHFEICALVLRNTEIEIT